LKIKSDTVDSAGLNVTIRPDARMQFFKAVTDEEVSGHEVKLTDRLIMTLKLDEEYKGQGHSVQLMLVIHLK
jgi:hypothetical protein